MLAGGRASRFGSDKLAALYRGRPLLDHAVERVSEVCDDVVVVLAPGADPASAPTGVRVVHDPTEGEGPLAGLHAGLLAAVRSQVALVAGGDMPELQPSVLRELLRAAAEPDVEAAALLDGDTLRPLPCAVSTWPAAEAAHMLLHAGRHRLRDLLGTLRTATIPDAVWSAMDPERRSLIDVDTRGDLPA